MQSWKNEGFHATNSHTKQINIKQSKSYLTYVRVNHAKVNKTVKWSFMVIKHVKIAKQSSKLTKLPCLKMMRYPLIDQLNAIFSSTSVQAWSSKSPTESPICGPVFFTCAPLNRKDSLLFGEKLVLKKSESPLFLFYFKGKIKQERKP